jgi:hypothetical protein
MNNSDAADVRPIETAHVIAKRVIHHGCSFV